MFWHRGVIARLESAGCFSKVELLGGKVRATIDRNRFLDIHFDPSTSSYSYSVIDIRLPFPGDKRIFGWDDFPHIGIAELEKLATHPHHFQKREGGRWIFEESLMRGDIENEVDRVIEYIKFYLDVVE